MAEWACVLCAAGGRESGPRWRKSAICEDHAATLAHNGQRWCHVHGRVDSVADGRCRACRNAASRAQYAANAEKKRAYQRARREADPGAWNARRRAWREANIEHVRRYHREHKRTWRVRRSAELKAWAARWREANRERLRQSFVAYRQRRKLAAFQRLFRGAPRAR